jgi:hypothetical protein
MAAPKINWCMKISTKILIDICTQNLSLSKSLSETKNEIICEHMEFELKQRLYL